MTQQQIISQYEKKSSEILQKMMQVFMRAQRKVDDEAYRKALASVENLK